MGEALFWESSDGKSEESESLIQVLREVSKDISAAPWKGGLKTRPSEFIQNAYSAVVAKRQRLQIAAQKAPMDLWDWSKKGPFWRMILLGSAVSVALTVALGLATFLTVLVATVLNAVVVAFLLALWGVSAVLAVFLTAVAAIAVGSVAVAAAVVTFATLCAVGFVLFSSAAVFCLWATWSVTEWLVGKFFPKSVTTKQVVPDLSPSVPNSTNQAKDTDVILSKEACAHAESLKSKEI